MRKQLFSMMLSLSAVGVATVVAPPPIQAAVAQDQVITVKGQVVDDQGEPLIGATVKAKNGKAGAVTDLDGNFAIQVKGNAVLQVSYLGYKEREVAVRGRAILEPIKLSSNDQVLEQVVVVGYGTQKKADLTGSVAVVNAEEMKKVSNSNISTMLEGKVAGVQITSDGQPGADPSVRIRGISTFGSTAPLYVIDGVPMGTTIRDFSPNDIETIQVLKDGASADIYGSRAANGVIIITTKNGKKDQPLKVDYSGYIGADWIPGSTYDTMNADQYSNLIGHSCVNSSTSIPGGYLYDGATDTYHFMDNTNTDWFNEVFKTGVRQNHNINLSGGSAKSTYNVGLDYFKQSGTLQGAGPNYDRFTARVNNTMETKFVKFRTSLVYSHSSQDGMGISNASEYVQGLYGDVTNVLRGTLLMQPTIKAYDESTWCLDDKVGAASNYKYDAYGYGVYYDNIHGDISASNPLLINNMITRNTLVDRFTGTFSTDVDILKIFGVSSKNHSLHYNLNLSYNTTHATDKTWVGAWIQSNRVYLSSDNEKLTKAARNYTTGLVENTLTYDGQLGLHHLNVVLGQTYEDETTNTLTGWGNTFSTPYFLQLQNASTRDASSYEYKHRLASFIGRINYNFADRYLLSLTVRRDGSSRLTSDKRWGTFPSVSAGWRFDKEKFFPISHDIVSMFKIRGSYGVLGNENIGEYQYLATLSRNNLAYSFGGQKVTGSAISTFINSNIAWEKKKSANVGLDLAMFRNRLEFSFEYYNNKSEDLLYSVPVPTIAGVDNGTVTMNAATMTNSGFEFSATYRNNDHPLKYSVSANLSTLKNRVNSLGFGTNQYLTGAYLTQEGAEIGKFYGYVYEGIARSQAQLDDHATQTGARVGDCLYKDVNGDGVIDENDRVVLGSGLPKVNFGISAHLEYKNFDLSVSTYGALGYHVTDDIWNSLHSSYGWANKSTDLVDANRFDAAGNYISSVPATYAATPSGASMNWNDLFSERYIQNANYWKIANIEIGYNFPNKWFKGVISGLRVYVSGQNLFTITGYKGYNVDYAGGTFTPGYNFCSYPSARTIMGGVHFSF